MHIHPTEHEKPLTAIPFQTAHLFYSNNFSAVTSSLSAYDYLALPEEDADGGHVENGR